ncbi:MAG: hypothetical protein WBB37_07910 [bacterium]
MINSLFCTILITINTTPQNIFFDNYTLIPPLGKIKSICATPLNVFAISDNYLLIFDKINLELEKVIYFDQDIDLVSYDQQTNDLWIAGPSNIIRFTIATYSIRAYPISDNIKRLGIGLDYIYLDGIKDYSLNKRTGELRYTTSFPGNLSWFKKTQDQDIRAYSFLTPYYYFDETGFTETPFAQFPISCVYDDGMELYVGTNQYGLLKYNKVSWLKQRIIYGPLDNRIRKAKKIGDKLAFISDFGISYLDKTGQNWQYRRFDHQITDVLFQDKDIIVTFENRISNAGAGVLITISNIDREVLCIASDDTMTYIGTTSGLYKKYNKIPGAEPFGQYKYAIYSIYPMSEEIFAGGETGFFKYNKHNKEWSKELGFGVKHIVESQNKLYLLTTNNQIIQYKNTKQNTSPDTGWVLLPYFNIYDIASDDEVIYCASYAGIYYYEPGTEAYKVIYNLPRIKFDQVFVLNKTIIAVSSENIYTLPVEYRD